MVIAVLLFSLTHAWHGVSPKHVVVIMFENRAFDHVRVSALFPLFF